MRSIETMCPILTAACIIYGGRWAEVTASENINHGTGIKDAACNPCKCMWAMRKTAMGEDGRYHTVGYRCAIAPGSDRYVDV